MDKADVMKRGELLEAYATHFAFRDWDYTRDTGVHRILYKNRKRKTRAGRTLRFDPSRLPYRVQHALTGLWRDVVTDPNWRKPEGHWTKTLNVSPWRMFKARLRENNLPDGVLDGGSVITYWEETGEYLQMVQPSVGALVAEWLQAEPENEYAQKVAAELERIAARYSERLRDDAG
jgi:hypothetical protein